VNIVRDQTVTTENAAKAHIDGAEAELSALPIRDLHLALSMSYLNARYTQFSSEDPARLQLGALDLTGNVLNFAPRYSATGDISYTVHTHLGAFSPRFNLAWYDKIYTSQFNVAVNSIAARFDLNAFINYANESGWTANLFVKNLANHVYLVSNSTTSVLYGYSVEGQYGPPRTFGLQVTRNF
jgi:iron complex outermembrane recepter protein